MIMHMHTLMMVPLPTTDILMKFSMDQEVIWAGKCQSLREETGLNVLSLLASEGEISSLSLKYLRFTLRAGSRCRVNHVYRNPKSQISHLISFSVRLQHAKNVVDLSVRAKQP